MAALAPDTAPIQLAPRYYLNNFERLCAAVLDQYADVLNDDEHAFLQRFASLCLPEQCLYLRLASRVGPWFRVSKLAYTEVGDIQAATKGLLAAHFVCRAHELELTDLEQLFTRPELAALFEAELAPASTRLGKSDLIHEIAALELSAGEHWQRVDGKMGEDIIAPLGGDILALLELLFFGNRRQGLTDFILSDIGVANYYPYTVDRRQRFFQNRAAVDEYLACGLFADAHNLWRDTRDPDELILLASELLDIRIEYASSTRRWQRLFNRVARDLERVGALEEALALYTRSEIHPARERAARVMEGLEDWSGAIHRCQQIIADPWCEDENEAAVRMLPRLQKKAGLPASRRRLDTFPQLPLEVAGLTGSVERDTATHLASSWQSVHYVENSLMCSLFGLAFWEQIFASVPGAFHNPYQSVPVDMYEQGFSRRRASLLEPRLDELGEVDLVEELLDAFRRYRGYQCRWTHWRALDEVLLRQALSIIPALHLLQIWRRILFDPGENRRGFPDLIAFGEEPGHYQMIEVKGPGDSLQESQKRWLRFFMAHEIPAAVAQVSWIDG